ncbi:YqzM family protein [Ammoniphilus sp. CFH 90114]|nr:YqzM family protein [Ammoniphilus sp. CFH 90114]RXT14916.1 YqzM family protein [Ammoniphilus sp. CFH 90114]
MEHKRDLKQDDIVDNVIGFGVSFGFFLLVAVIFTIASLFQH